MPTGALTISPIGPGSHFPFPAREPLWVPKLLSSLPSFLLGSSKETKNQKTKTKNYTLILSRAVPENTSQGRNAVRHARLGECLLWLGCIKIKLFQKPKTKPKT